MGSDGHKDCPSVVVDNGKGAKRVEIAGIDDKHQIMDVFAATAVSEFLPVQLTIMYQGTTAASLPAFTFPGDWSVTYTPQR